MKQLSLFALALLLCAASCKKQETKDIEKAGSNLIGAWNVDEIALHTTDTMGNTIGTDVVLNAQGLLSFSYGDKGAIGAAYFDNADFTGPCANSELVQYFSVKAAGDRLPDNGWRTTWDADPEDLRVQFWAQNAGGSYHRIVNHSYDGGGQVLYYVVQPQYQNRRLFYTWKLSKQ